jgi:hypothetical protein
VEGCLLSWRHHWVDATSHWFGQSSASEVARTSVPQNNELQRTKHGQDGASPLNSVFCGLLEGPGVSTRTSRPS